MSSDRMLMDGCLSSSYHFYILMCKRGNYKSVFIYLIFIGCTLCTVCLDLLLLQKERSMCRL